MFETYKVTELPMENAFSHAHRLNFIDAKSEKLRVMVGDLNVKSR
jgi:hypothetical protein